VHFVEFNFQARKLTFHKGKVVHSKFNNSRLDHDWVCTRISDRNIRELIYPKGVLKMTYSRNRYDQDFKKNAVRLSFNSSKPVKIIASELGVPESALYRWRKLYTEDGKQTPFASLEAENRALKRENAELALERDMLKKAAAYFASLQK
jgi:transposase